MRQVFTLVCPKCKYTKVVAIGEDKNPEDKIERVRAQIKSGVYGDDMRHFYADHPESRFEARQALYRCNRCGFGAKAHHWQCPSCKNWGTVRPIHSVVSE